LHGKTCNVDSGIGNGSLVPVTPERIGRTLQLGLLSIGAGVSIGLCTRVSVGSTTVRSLQALRFLSPLLSPPLSRHALPQTSAGIGQIRKGAAIGIVDGRLRLANGKMSPYVPARAATYEDNEVGRGLRSVQGGAAVHGRWPGLKSASPDNGVDLAVTADISSVLGELMWGPLGRPT
jgi:hypothetical protein